jgi:hypothetical protein
MAVLERTYQTTSFDFVTIGTMVTSDLTLSLGSLNSRVPLPVYINKKPFYKGYFFWAVTDPAGP